MRLLLDSHVVVWAMSSPEKLRASTREAIIAPENDVFVSAASLWELKLKASKGKLLLPDAFIESLTAQEIIELPIRWTHTRNLARFPAIHADPFDHLLLAQAAEEGLTFVTADRQCLEYPVLLMEA